MAIATANGIRNSFRTAAATYGGGAAAGAASTASQMSTSNASSGAIGSMIANMNRSVADNAMIQQAGVAAGSAIAAQGAAASIEMQKVNAAVAMVEMLNKLANKVADAVKAAVS